MRVLFLRHGATAGNEEHRYVGRRTNEPLSDVGREQCARFGENRTVRRVYASPLRRACETARLCFPCAELVCVAGLEEFDFGAFEGRTAQEMEHDEAYRAWVDSWCVDPCPGGEARADFVRRTRAALDELVARALAQNEDHLVVVAHGGTIMAALDGFYHKGVGNCEGYVVRARMEDGHAVFGDERRVCHITQAQISA